MSRVRLRTLAPLVLAALIVLPAASRAASYDCHSSKLSPVEKNVCARPVLSALDDRLAAAYKAARAQDESVVSDQRQWITTERNHCADNDCLFNAYIVRLAALRARAHTCPVPEDKLVGSWINDDKDGDVFDSIAFERDTAGGRTFESWLHEAPFASGPWVLKDCAVHVAAGGAGQLDIDLTILGFENGRLEVATDMAEHPLRFKRAPKR